LTKILLLGSTGSIGKSTLNCIRRFSDRFTIEGLAAGKSASVLIEQIAEFSPSSVYLADSSQNKHIRSRFGDAVKIYEGEDGLERLVDEADYDVLLNALVGSVGLRSTVAALKRKKKVALANKESLVVGGEIICNLLDEGFGELVPVDSEHSAILQCISGFNKSDIESIILTASGGPFRLFEKERFRNIKPSDALKHPTWSMGKKITIDSATLMNKGFEVIEAHYLFRLPYNKLRVWIHPQSIIHSLVEFHDGAVLAQLGTPDMELPIQYALSYPERFPMNGKRLSLPEIGKLEFYNPDLEKFPCLKLCIEAGEMGGTAPAVVNAANEVAVESFLKGEISFSDISEIVAYALQTHANKPGDTLKAIEEADKYTRLTVIDRFNLSKVKQ